MGKVAAIVATQSSTGRSLAIIVEMILEVSVARILALTPLPRPSARTTTVELSLGSVSYTHLNIKFLIIYRYSYTWFITLLHAECSFEIHLPMQVIFFNHLLEGLDHIIGTFDMTGATDTNAKFYHLIFPPL